jgi:hypothetical protein
MEEAHLAPVVAGNIGGIGVGLDWIVETIFDTDNDLKNYCTENNLS